MWGAPEEAVLSSVGLQIPQGNCVILQEGGAGFEAQVFKALVLPRVMYGEVESWALRDTGYTIGDLPQCLPEADVGPPPRPRRALHR